MNRFAVVAILFLSDLHLHPSRPAIIDCFVHFLLAQQGRAQALYILGDLFEAWIGDDHPDPGYEPVKTALRACHEAETPVYLMHGNRDFLIGERFCEETGCVLLPDPTRIDLYGTPTLLMHGDTLCTDDAEYQSLRTQVRDAQWQRRILALPVRERLALAQQARELSTLATQGKDEYIMDVNAGEVLRVIEEYKVDLLIHGHTHRPAVHHCECRGRRVTRIVLGDWYTRGSVLVVTRQALTRENPCQEFAAE